MKKFMVADMVKGIREDLIQIAMEEYNLNESEATRFVDNFPNQSTWADVEATAESLGVDVTDLKMTILRVIWKWAGQRGDRILSRTNTMDIRQ
jgi:hypothetical protein